MFKKILIANRGEIAVRIIQAAQKLQVRTVAIYAEDERTALHVQQADEAYGLSEGDLSDTYLHIDKIIDIAQQSGCEAIHPGYGFLSENPAFVEACEQANITFIGPNSQTMQIMGDKIQARDFVKKAGVPVTEGITGTTETLLEEAATLEFPVLVKAAAGGGGKGMRIVRKADELPEALQSTSREAKAYFGHDAVYIEKYLENPRHIEIQLLGDHYGNLVHLYERECSLQRRYQKIIEEAPSPTLTPDLRKKMGEAALRIGEAINYTNAGTIEFLLDSNHDFYFLEMNTRVQVEHPVTELTTGVDIVVEQIKIAAGEALSFAQEDIPHWGHAIECRVYAEDPKQNFMPSPGTITYYHPPTAGAIRLDSAVVENTNTDSRYDPMIGKLIAYGTDRERARQHAIDALQRFAIHGIDTNLVYLSQLLSTDDFKENNISTHYCDQHTPEILEQMEQAQAAVDTLPILLAGVLYSFHHTAAKATGIWQELGFWRQLPSVPMTLDGADEKMEIREQAHQEYEVLYQDITYSVVLRAVEHGEITFTIDKQPYTGYVSQHDDQTMTVTFQGFNFQVKRNDLPIKNRSIAGEDAEAVSDDNIVSPMPGKVIKLSVKAGDQVKRGDTLLVVEAMKMENSITAPRDAQVKEVHVAEQDRVERNKPLVVLE